MGGGVLSVAIVVMFVLAILCVAMISISQMNLRYDTFFERRSVLKHATVSLARILAAEVAANANEWRNGSGDLNGSGEFLTTSIGVSDISPMRFTYRVGPSDRGSSLLTLFVQGEYVSDSDAGAKENALVWDISTDIVPNGSSIIRKSSGQNNSDFGSETKWYDNNGNKFSNAEKGSR
jgi:hypothetical protein